MNFNFKTFHVKAESSKGTTESETDQAVRDLGKQLCMSSKRTTEGGTDRAPKRAKTDSTEGFSNDAAFADGGNVDFPEPAGSDSGSGSGSGKKSWYDSFVPFQHSKK